MINNDFREFIQTVINCLNDSGIKYVIVGGLASTIYGRPRTTLDIDMIIDDTNENIYNLENVLRENGFDFNQDEIIIAIQERSHCSIFHTSFPFRIYIQGTYSSLDERSVKNREKRIILRHEAFVEKPEDLIIAKLVYGSQQDLEDVKAIIIRQKRKLDKNYLELIAEKEQIKEKLDKILTYTKE